MKARAKVFLIILKCIFIKYTNEIKHIEKVVNNKHDNFLTK